MARTLEEILADLQSQQVGVTNSGATDVGLTMDTARSDENGWLSSVTDFFGQIEDAGLKAYSTFIQASTVADLAKAQSAKTKASVPTAAQLAQQRQMQNYVVYGGLALALLGGMWMFYKAVK